MRTVLLLLTALWALTAVPAESAPPQGKQLTSQDVLKWINSYRAKPDPTRLSEAVRAMSALGLFRDLDQAGIYIGFMAGVIGDNKAIADTLVGKMFPIPPEDQVAVIRAIAYSGLPDWKDLLGRFIERMPARTVLIQRHLAGKLPDLQGLPLDQSPAALDTLWGFYFATGRFPTIDRIIGALAWSKDANNVERLTLGLMAKWTLANNAQLDKELLDHLKAQLNAQPKEVAKDLREIIEAAETFETTKIRRDALNSIEDLKRRGPEDKRTVAWWGQAGQTALALGCVVASVLGHPEIGIPCVVGGAVSSAAIKVLTPQ